MKLLTLVYVAKDNADLDAFDKTFCDAADLVGIVNVGRLPLAAIGNELLDRCQTPIFGLCHADAVFGLNALGAFISEAMAGAVCGIVGVRLDGKYECCYSIERTAASPVSTLDGMAVFFRRSLGLHFDAETFDGLHCHVEDLCLQAHAWGIIPVTVPAADAHHRNHQQTAAWTRDYQMYRARLAEKWQGMEFRTT